MTKLPIALLMLAFAVHPAMAQQDLEEQLAANQLKHDSGDLVFPQSIPLAGLRLMFTESERQALDHALNPDLYNAPSTGSEEAASPSPDELQLPPPLFLAGFSYESPSEWSLWLNDTRLRSGRISGEFEIVNVNRHGVELIWKPALYRGIYHVVLRPRQTFLPDKDIVVDGDARPAPTDDTKAAAK